MIVSGVGLIILSGNDPSVNHSTKNGVEQVTKNEFIENEFSAQNLISQNEEIEQEFMILKENYHNYKTLDREQYYQEMLALREEQLKLYEDVKNHKFGENELKEYNYWYRSTLKFPSNLSLELSEIEEERYWDIIATEDEKIKRQQRAVEESLESISYSLQEISQIDDKYENIIIQKKKWSERMV